MTHVIAATPAPGMDAAPVSSDIRYLAACPKGDSMSEAIEPQITLDEDAGRFEVPVEDNKAVLKFRKVDDRTLDYVSTVVPPEARGRGIAGKLVRHALDWARDGGYEVIPTCSYVQSWIERHEDYQDLVAEA
jgi:predicted GNAT family acetyltransferase